jgi:hypothetical protein
VEDFMADSNFPRGADVAGTDAGRSEGIVDKMKHSATSQLTNQKNRASEGLGSVAQAVRQSGQQLREGQHDSIARFTDQAADQIERLNQKLRDKDITELFDDVQRLARREPALFIGGAFAVGLLGARFFKSSARAQEREWNGPSPGGYQSRSAGQYASGGMGSGEVRSYAGVSGMSGYAGAGQTQVHDYQSTPAVADATGTPSISDSSDTTTDADIAAGRSAATRSRTRRTTQSERS